MRVAVCFSGAIRSFKSCYPSIYKCILEPLNNPDVFIHAWSYGDVKEHMDNKEYLTHHKLQGDECSYDYVLKMLNPKKYIIEDYSKEWEDKIISGCNGYEIIKDMNQHDRNYAINAMGMYYKIMKCNELKCMYEERNKVKYDLVIRLRFDFYWSDIIYPVMFDNKMPKNDAIYLIKDAYATNAKWEGNDKFFAGSSEVMDKVCCLYSQIHMYYKNKVCDIEGQNLNKFCIKMNNLNIKWLGDKHTYEKCQGRHRIKLRPNIYYIYGCNTLLGFHLSEYLLKMGIQVVGCDEMCTDIKNLNRKILSNYPNFSYNDHIPTEEDYNTYSLCIVVNDKTVFNAIELNRKIFIQTNDDVKNISNDYKQFISLVNNNDDRKNLMFVSGLFGENCDSKNCLAQTVINNDTNYISNNLFYVKTFVDKLFHIIYDKKNKNNYVFSNKYEMINGCHTDINNYIGKNINYLENTILSNYNEKSNKNILLKEFDLPLESKQIEQSLLWINNKLN